MVNIERIDRALDEIRAHPERHFQRAWLTSLAPQPDDASASDAPLTCGTGGCIAGLAMLQEYPDGKPVSLCAWAVKDVDEDHWDGLEMPDGAVYSVSRQAQRLFGLNEEQADTLFEASNTLRDLEAIRDALAANPNADGNDLYDAINLARGVLVEPEGGE